MGTHPLQKISLGVDLGEETEERETRKGCVLGESGCVLERIRAEEIKEAGLGLGRLLLGRAKGAHSALTVG